jgi:hypothetical protein
MQGSKTSSICELENEKGNSKDSNIHKSNYKGSRGSISFNFS